MIQKRNCPAIEFVFGETFTQDRILRRLIASESFRILPFLDFPVGSEMEGASSYRHRTGAPPLMLKKISPIVAAVLLPGIRVDFA